MDDQLEEQYRQILTIIKSYIPQVTNSNSINQYRIWLEKLSESNQNKRERNQYLLELAKQIQNGILAKPFTDLPPSNDLLPPPGQIFDCGGDAHHNNDDGSWLDLNDDIEISTSKDDNVNNVNVEAIGSKLKIEGMELKQHYEKKYEADNSDELSMIDSTADIEDLKRKLKSLIEVKTSLRQAQILTEEYRSKFDHLQQQLMEKNQNLAELKNKLKDSQLILEQERQQADKLQGQLNKRISQNTELAANVSSLHKKIDDLENKVKCSRATESKLTAHIQQLEMELKQKEKENNELHKTVDSLQLKIEELRIMENDSKKSLNEELELLKKQLKNTQKWFETNKDTHAKQVTEILTENQSLLKEKEQIISKLELMLQEETIKAETELKKSKINEDQVVTLKKTLSRTEKLFERTEKDYVRKIDKLRIEYEFKERELEMKLQEKHFETIARYNALKQTEVDEIINSLEIKYAKMVDNIQLDTLEIRRKNEEVIEGLKLILDKNDIVYQ